MTKRYSTEQFEKAIQGSRGTISRIAKIVGCDWNTARSYINDDPRLKQMLEDEKEAVLDVAETNIIDSIYAGDLGISKWVLSTLGKKRGYTEKQEVELSGVVKGYITVSPDDWDE